MTIAICILTGIVSLAIGVVFGALPLRADAMTEKQTSLQQALGIAGVGIVIVLIIVKQDTASWIAIGAMIVGVLIAKIPPLHRLLIARFPAFAPKQASNAHAGKSTAKTNRKSNHSNNATTAPHASESTKSSKRKKSTNHRGKGSKRH